MKKLKFRKNDGSTGSITVLVTLILVPTIFINAFMVDLARLKLYGDQAAMTADNYGEALLSVYDNVLKDIYGLFAMSNNKAGEDAVKLLEGYLTSSFNPNSNTISWSHLNALLPQTSYSGFMPYESAEVTLSKDVCTGANLANEKVLATQLGDFMRFRIAQAVGDQGSAVIEAIDMVKNSKADSKAIDQKNDFDELVGDLLKEMKNYYELLEKVDKYDEYIKRISDARNTAEKVFNDMKDSDSWKRYYAYMSEKWDVDAAVLRSNTMKEGETLTPEEIRLCNIYHEYNSDPNAQKDAIKSTLQSVIDAFEDTFDSEPIDMDSYGSIASKLTTSANNIKKKYDEVAQKKEELEKTLQSKDMTKEVRDGISEDIAVITELFDKYGAQKFIDLAKFVTSGTEYNKDLKTSTKQNVQKLESMRDLFLQPDSNPTKNGFGPKIDTNRYFNDYQFNNVRRQVYKELFELLAQTFSDSGDDSKAKSKKKEAEEKQKEAEKALKEEENSDARDIPSSFGMGSDKTLDDISIVRLIKTAASYLDAGSLGEGFNDLLLKFYITEYDFSMFSNRTTNIGEDEKKAETLTGYLICDEINYLNGAELEYIFGGFNSSDKNLSAARNKILAFRAVINYAATYKIKQINDAIKGIVKLVPNPALKIAVAAALRLGITALETAQDWADLKAGKEVIVLKQKLEDMSTLDAIGSLLGENLGDGESKAFKLDYENYLMVMLLFLTTDTDIIRRTGHLICLNVNTVEQGLEPGKELTELKFKLEEAVTAVKATCSVHLDFVVIPDSMAKAFLSGDDYDTLTSNAKNVYSFTVTRGY